MIDTLLENVRNMHGVNGERWVEQIPSRLRALSQRWHLDDIKPVTNMTWHYIAIANQQGKPVVCKLGINYMRMINEFNALTHFKGHACIDVLEFDHSQQAILLACALPGTPLYYQYPNRISETILRYAAIVKSLKLVGPATKKFQCVSDWLKNINISSKNF